MAVKADEVKKKTLTTWLSRTDSSALAGNWPKRDSNKTPVLESRKAQQRMGNKHRVPTLPSIMWPCKSLLVDMGSSLWVARSQVRTVRPDPQPQRGPPHATDCDWFSGHQGRTELSD